MPNYANPLYANGVPTYSNEVGALSEVFKALAPNPLRDLQVQGYASNARLSKLRGDVIENQQAGLGTAADAFMTGDTHGAYGNLIRSGNSKVLTAMPGTILGDYSARALQDPNSVDPDIQATLSVGAGHDYKTTVPGFNLNQDRLTQEANQKNDTTMRGQDMTQGTAFRGQNMTQQTAFRGQDIGADNATYGANLRFLKPGGAGGAGAGGTTGGGAAAGELNPKGVAELDSALANVLTGRAVPSADRADLAARTQAHYLAQPKGGRNFQLAANRAVDDVQQGADLASSTDENYFTKDELMTKPAQERAPLPEPWQPPPKVAAGGGGMSPVAQTILQGNPNLRRPLSAAQLSAPAPTAAPAAAPSGPVRVNSPADLAGLPSGTQFITPDGRIKYVP